MAGGAAAERRSSSSWQACLLCKLGSRRGQQGVADHCAYTSRNATAQPAVAFGSRPYALAAAAKWTVGVYRSAACTFNTALADAMHVPADA